jgi:hypothetical protein
MTRSLFRLGRQSSRLDLDKEKEKEKSREIDRKLRNDKKNREREVRVLLLGSSATILGKMMGAYLDRRGC